MAKVTRLPGSRTVTVPVGRKGSIRLTPFRGSPLVLLELRGPNGGDLGGLVLHAGHAQLLADGLVRVADGEVRPRAVGMVLPPEAGTGATPGLLATSLDRDATVVAFARLAVPLFADWCSVDVTEGEELPRRLAVIHADTAKRKAARTLARYPHDPSLAHPRSSVWRSGTPELAPDVSDVSDVRLAAAARNEEHLAVLRALRPRSSVAVPLLGGGDIRGVITFALAESRRRYADRDLPLAVMLANCAALAAENARLYAMVHAALRPRLGESRGQGSGRRRGGGQRT